MSSLEMKTNSPQRGSLRPWLGILGCGLMAATVPIKADTTIVYSGTISGSEVAGWRTSAVAKTKDLDHDNIYGTWAAVNWQHNSYQENAHWTEFAKHLRRGSHLIAVPST